VPDVQVGTAVLLPALRNPVILAHQLATLDQISEGRLIVGVGIGADTPASRAEFAAAGVPFAKRVGRLVEGLQLCRALWSGDPVDWDGRWPVVQGQLAPLPFQSGGPPIWLASSVPAGIRRAARLFDGWFPIGPDPTGFAENHKIYRSVAPAGGTDATTALYLTIALDENADRAQVMIDDYLSEYYGLPPQILRKVQACFGGPLEEVVAFIRSYVDAGAQHVVLRIVGDHLSTLRKLGGLRGELNA
jgi:alkanesulfonate monooxygenase SsuD/methylene tetrahydromethanopterin reductase-like flavin-dependent oxidoreductase (luciferase family)